MISGSDLLTLSPDGGWLRGGVPWRPQREFYAVLGDPVEHSLSPQMHLAALAERELEHEYLAACIAAGQLRRLKDGSWPVLLAGFNVTAPLKEEASQLCDGRSDVAHQLGAVNTVRVEAGKWIGHNTDSGGILAVLSEAWRRPDPPRSVTLLGSGGAARAALHAVVRWGVNKVTVLSRSAASRKRLETWLEQAAWLTSAVGVHVSSLADAAARPEVAEVYIVCLAAAVEVNRFLPDAATMEDQLLLDLRYGAALPAEPAPLGFTVLDGRPVLLMQGGLSFAWWFGPPLPWQAMRRAIS